ncbi:leucine-rich repeat domain-containing protein [Tenacibaculum litopenaei]|jgi:transposase|uniref:leucine-rich repeat domain-containing protein n=1 Tax=Tenacibaculum litopenaei TaxID=396016 RepID=UPI0038B4F7D1
MKLISTCLAAFLLTLQLTAQETIPIPDVGFEEALIALKYDSNGLTGNILVSDIKYIVNLNINNATKNEKLPNVNSPIKSLEGIEHFSNLKRLDCAENAITKLDLSKNAQLNFLNCSDNKIEYLDLSNNPELYAINCDYNKLGTLLLGEKPALKDLYCNNNQLQSLDISGCATLTNLDASSNKMKTLFIKKEYYDALSEGWYKDPKTAYAEKSGEAYFDDQLAPKKEAAPAPSQKQTTATTPAATASTTNSASANDSAASYFEKFKKSVVAEYDQLVLAPKHLTKTQLDIQAKYHLNQKDLSTWISQYGKLSLHNVERSKSTYTIDSSTHFLKKFRQSAIEEYESLILDAAYLRSKREEIQKKYNISASEFNTWLGKYGKLSLKQAPKPAENAADYYNKFKKAVVAEYEMAVLSPAHLLSTKEAVQKKYKLSAKELGDWITQLSTINR